jgi:hypothetical protein
MRASTFSVASGSTRFGSSFGSRMSTHGEATMIRSRTAVRKMPVTNEYTTPMVDGARSRSRPRTHAWTSDGRMEPSGRSPKVG